MRVDRQIRGALIVGLIAHLLLTGGVHAQVLYAISGVVRSGGNAVIAGVTVSLSGGISRTTTTDANGAYAFAGLTSGRTYAVAPSRSGYTFSPDSRTYAKLSKNQTNVNFNGSGVAVPTNVAPTVALAFPASGSQYIEPATITLRATASDSDGTIASVNFFSGTAQVGTDALAPYDGTWSNVPAGSYSLTAVATDNSGATTTSAAVTVTVTASGGGGGSGEGGGSRVQPANLIYQGAFRVPAGLHSGGQANQGFEYGGTAIGYNPAANSLYMVGHDWDQFVGEITIPQLATGSLSTLATASLLQPLTDVTEGRMSSVNPGDPNSKKVGGLLPDQGRLYTTVYSYYDGEASQRLSHFVSGTNLATRNDVNGPYEVGTLGAGFVSGYFGHVPVEWQSALGGPVVNGQCCLAIISRSSYGPALFTIRPADLGTVNPLPAAPLVYYPSSNPLALWDSTSSLFNGTTQVTGVVFPNGSRSVLFFGRHGTGTFCYGPGTSDPSLAGKRDPGGDTWCYDPADSSKGVHAYPYEYRVWAYDAGDLAAVRCGGRQPWEPRPYATWQLQLPYTPSGVARLLGATYDSSTNRIFVSQGFGDGERPVVHVYRVQLN